MIAASSGLDRQTVIRRGIILFGGAMAHFKRRNGMLIIDRDGAGFEIALVKGDPPNATDLDAGQRFFAGLRITDRADRFAVTTSQLVYFSSSSKSPDESRQVHTAVKY